MENKETDYRKVLERIVGNYNMFCHKKEDEYKLEITNNSISLDLGVTIIKEMVSGDNYVLSNMDFYRFLNATINGLVNVIKRNNDGK